MDIRRAAVVDIACPCRLSLPSSTFAVNTHDTRNMVWGILSDKHLEHVPGTSLLSDRAKQDIEVSEEVLGRLKKGTGRYSHIVLQPQPSDDPRDPLNWPRWKKEGLFWSLTYSAGLAGAVGPLLAPGYGALATEWNVTVNQVAAYNGWAVLSLSLVMLFVSPLASKFGKRPQYLLAAALLFFCSIWSAVSKGVVSFTWSRVFQGAGMAAYENLFMASLADVYFVHERATRTAVWSFALVCGLNIAPIVNGKLIGDGNWRVVFWVMTGCLAANFLAIIFFCPETAYDRHYDSAMNPGSQIDGSVHNDEAIADKLGEKDTASDSKGSNTPVQYLPAKTFLQELAPWSGYSSRHSVVRSFCRPFLFALSPVVWFGEITYGITTIWLVCLSIGSSIIFGMSYGFTAEQVGYTSGGPMVTAVIGIAAGPAIDWMCTKLARRNHGVFEPEFRLAVFPLVILLSAGGYFAMGGLIAAGTHWIGPVIMLSILNLGGGISGTAVTVYLVDCHRKDASEVFAVVTLVKNIILWGFTQFAANWIIETGVSKTFYILGALQAICILFYVPQWIFGKRMRSWIARHENIFVL